MSAGDENVTWVLAWLEAWRRGDGEAVLAGLDPAVEVRSAQEVGNPGTYLGHAGYRKWEERWLDAWEDFRNEIVRAEPVGRRHVVVDARQSGTGRGSGVAVERDVTLLCEIRDGRAVRFHIYATHDEALVAARRGESRG
jgi:ketosteroid isomerase-like protein